MYKTIKEHEDKTNKRECMAKEVNGKENKCNCENVWKNRPMWKKQTQREKNFRSLKMLHVFKCYRQTPGSDTGNHWVYVLPSSVNSLKVITTKSMLWNVSPHKLTTPTYFYRLPSPRNTLPFHWCQIQLGPSLGPPLSVQVSFFASSDSRCRTNSRLIGPLEGSKSLNQTTND